MDEEIIELLKKIKYYFLLFGIFLGIEIPLANYVCLWLIPLLFPEYQAHGTLIIVLVSSTLGILTSLFFYLVIKSVFLEDYQKRILHKDPNA